MIFFRIANADIQVFRIANPKEPRNLDETAPAALSGFAIQTT